MDERKIIEDDKSNEQGETPPAEPRDPTLLKQWRTPRDLQQENIIGEIISYFWE